MILVVLAHAGVRSLPGGYVGVDVFFVLSGFLITGLLLSEARAGGSVSLLEFYVRRARRILPAATLTLIVTDVGAYFFLNFVRARDAVGDGFWAAAFSANFRFAARGVDYFAQSQPPSPFLHYWSLGVEEQFYVVWPLLLSLVLFGVVLWRHRSVTAHDERRLFIVVVALAAASLAWSIHATSATPTSAYYSPFTRAWELGLGAAVCLSVAALSRIPTVGKLAMGWAGVAAIAAAAVLFTDRTPFPGSAALLPTAGTALAVAAGVGTEHSRLAVGRLLALRPMRIVGDRSFALYLWHWPVLILALQYAGHTLPLSAKLGLAVAAFLLSCASYSLVENPIRRRIRSGAGTGAVVAVFMAAVVGTGLVSLTAIAKERHRFEAPVATAAVAPKPTAVRAGVHETAGAGALPEVVAAVRAAERGDPIPSGLTPRIGQLRTFPAPYLPPEGCISHDTSPTVVSKICRLGQPASHKLLILMGDSHAMMWLPAVLEMAWRDGWAVVPLLRQGCTPDKWVTRNGPETCRSWYHWALLQIERLHPRVTLVGGNVSIYDTPAAHATVAGIVAAARELVPVGRVVVIGDPEGLDQNPVDCILSKNASMRRCTTTWPPAARRAYTQVAAQAKQVRAGFLATRSLVSFEDHYPAVIGHTIAYMDDNHITVAYSSQVADAFRAAFLQAVAGVAR